MSATRAARGLLLALSLALVLAPSCAAELKQAPKQATTPALVDPAARAGRPLVMVVMPDSESLRSVRRSLVDEVSRDLNVVTYLVDGRTTSADIGAAIETHHPACVVLMNNPTVGLYRQYQQAHKGQPNMPAGVVVMSSFLEELRADLVNVTGVAYEVPGVTALGHLRSIIEQPVSRVGVVHRPAFRRFLERQKTLAGKEQFTVVAAEVPATPSASDVRNALRTLRSSGRIDALWVLNDNALFGDASFLADGWREELTALGIPVVVGVPGLVSVNAHFGTLAVVPDLEAMGMQTANIIFELSENDWRADRHPLELPISTQTVVNMSELSQRFRLRPGAQKRIDKVIE